MRSQDGIVYLSTGETGKALGVGPARVRQLVYLDSFAGVTYGKKRTIWIPEAEVQKFKALRPWNEKLVLRRKFSQPTRREVKP